MAESRKPEVSPVETPTPPDQPEGDMVEVRLPSNAAPGFAHGEHSFSAFKTDPRSADYHAWVTREAAQHFVHTGGFEMVEHTVIMKTGPGVRMYHPAEPTGKGIGIGGERFEPGAGRVTVNDVSYVVTEIPVEAVGEAQSFGFMLAPPAEEAPTKAAEKPQEPHPHHPPQQRQR